MSAGIYAGPDPDHDELRAAAEHMVRVAGAPGHVDFDVMALLLIHRDTPEHVKREWRAKGATEIPGDGTMLEMIDGERLSKFGIVAQDGSARVMIITRLSCRCILVPTSTDDEVVARGRDLLARYGGRS